MSFLKKLLGHDEEAMAAGDRPSWMRDGMTASLFEGSDLLEVKGESFYQDEIRRVVASQGREIAAILVPEPENEYDPNAVAVWVGGLKVGHLPREVAADYQKSIERLMEKEGQPIALSGQIFGGESGKSHLGVWLYHDPADFGIATTSSGVGSSASGGGVNTGTVAGSLLWLQDLPADGLAAIKRLRALLSDETDPVERHFMYLELEKHLYKSRDVFESALAEFEATCVAHDSEMESIVTRLREELGGVPGLLTYKQAAIMKQKAHEFEAALWWAERGLELYGDDAIRRDNVEDLQRRVERYRGKLESAD